MNFHLAITLPAEIGKIIEEFRPVLLAREEKRVLRRLAIGIAKLTGKFRIILQPILSARPSCFKRRFRPKRFVMVNKAKKHMRRRNKFAPLSRGEVTGQPNLGIFKNHVVRCAFWVQVAFCRPVTHL